MRPWLGRWDPSPPFAPHLSGLALSGPCASLGTAATERFRADRWTPPAPGPGAGQGRARWARPENPIGHWEFSEVLAAAPGLVAARTATYRLEREEARRERPQGSGPSSSGIWFGTIFVSWLFAPFSAFCFGTTRTSGFADGAKQAAPSGADHSIGRFAEELSKLTIDKPKSEPGKPIETLRRGLNQTTAQQ